MTRSPAYYAVQVLLLLWAGLLASIYLKLPALIPLTPAAIVLGGISLAVLKLRRRLRAAQLPLDEPPHELAARAEAACGAAGRPGQPIRWVQGAGLTIIQAEGGSLLLSPDTPALLDEPQLAALVKAVFVVPHLAPQRHLRALLVQLGVMSGILLVPFAMGYSPLVAFLTPLLLVVMLWVHRTGPDGDRHHAQLFYAITKAGIDPIAYGAAFSRLSQHAYQEMLSPVQRQLLKRLGQHLELLADIAGVAPSRLQSAVNAAGVPVVLDWGGQGAPWWHRHRHLLLFPMVLLIVLVISAAALIQSGISLPAFK